MNVQQYFRVPKNVTPPGPDPDAFIMTFALGASDSITLPLVNSGTYNFDVDWGDGSSDNITVWNQAERVHSYSGQPAGDYVVTITGTIVNWSFLSVTTSRSKLKSVDQWPTASLGNIGNGFRQCNNLISIAPGIIASELDSAFILCTSLASVPVDLLINCGSNTNFRNLLYGCSALTSIPLGLFDPCVSATNMGQMFYQCTSLTTVPSGLFDYNTSVTQFFGLFFGCTALTSIPSGLFDYNTSVTTFLSLFDGCSSLTSIPSGLFDNNTLVTTFAACFQNSSLTSIPSGLFDNNTLVTTFNRTFWGVDITSIPSGLFDNNTSVTDFGNTFRICTSLTSIPSGLFTNNTSVTTFSGAFYQCTSLTTIPTTLFNTNINVTTYLATFQLCSALNVSVSSLVLGMTMTACTTTNVMFSGCTSLTGNGADLIAKPKSGSYTVGTASNTGSYQTFFNCTSLTDFATISANYK